MPLPLLDAALIGGGSLLGGILGSSAASEAAQAQAAAARYAADLQYKQYLQQREDYEPFRQAGILSQNELSKRLGIGTAGAGTAEYGALLRPFSMADYQQDPGYQFRLKEGLKQLQSSAAARGGALSGATQRGVQNFAQGLASQEYGNAYDRYTGRQRDVYNMLSGQQAVGERTTTQLGQAGQNYANQAGEYAVQAGNARASGYVGAANAWNNALGQIGNMYMINKMMTSSVPSAYQYAGPYGLGSAQAGLATTTTTPGMTTISY